jgi:hypothetical protein
MENIQDQIEELDRKISRRFDAINARLRENTEFVRAFFKEHPEAVIRTGRHADDLFMG